MGAAMKITGLVLAAALLVPGLSLAQSSATPTLPGSLTTSGCSAGLTSCYNPYSATNPLPTTTTLTPSGATSAAIVPTPSGALESCHVLKSGGGNLYSLAVTIQATSGVVQVFDATSAPADGAVTPVWAMPVLSNGTFGGANWEWSVPMNFLTGITVCFSSATTPFTKTASATAMFSGDVK